MLDQQEWQSQNERFGKAVFESIPVSQRADWAGSIVLFLSEAVEKIELLDELWEISLDDSKFLSARGLFNLLRAQTLKNEQNGFADSKRQKLLDVGETAAK